MTTRNNLPSAVNLLDDPVVRSIAEKHERSAGQIVLKFLLQLGVSVVPKSSQPERLKQNIDLFSFSLDSEDFQRLETLDKGSGGRSNFAWKK